MNAIAVPVLVCVLFLLAACSSVGTLGIVTRSTADPASIFKSGRTYQEIGPAEGQACRFFVIAVIPFGDSTFSTAVERALAERGGTF